MSTRQSQRQRAGRACAYYPFEESLFIFANAVGTHDDVQTLCIEAGHASMLEARHPWYVPNSS
ncbi:MAG: hypothetical protein H6636_01115 [Anaerolineales bacterium]|nr:hypothetical protein [Anaerolineales bacterium]